MLLCMFRPIEVNTTLRIQNMFLGERNGDREVTGSSRVHRTVVLTNILFLPLKNVLKEGHVFVPRENFVPILPSVKPEFPVSHAKDSSKFGNSQDEIIVMVIYTIYPVYSLMMQVFLPPLSFSSPSARGRPSDIGMIRIGYLRCRLIPPTPAAPLVSVTVHSRAEVDPLP